MNLDQKSRDPKTAPDLTVVSIILSNPRCKNEADFGYTEEDTVATESMREIRTGSPARFGNRAYHGGGQKKARSENRAFRVIVGMQRSFLLEDDHLPHR